jgi:integrase/recombinase XerD
MIYGKGGIYGTKSKRRILPLTDRIRPLIDGHFAIHDTIGMTPRTIQRILKRVANKAHINRPVTPHVLRHTFAVAAVQKGISLPALQRLLGVVDCNRNGPGLQSAHFQDHITCIQRPAQDRINCH